MIRKLEDSDIQVIELGKGTTFISQVFVENGTASSGFLFSNHNDGKIHGDEIMIQITDFKGVASYLRSALELLNTWEIQGAERHIKELLDILKPMLNFENNEQK